MALQRRFAEGTQCQDSDRIPPASTGRPHLKRHPGEHHHYYNSSDSVIHRKGAIMVCFQMQAEVAVRARHLGRKSASMCLL